MKKNSAFSLIELMIVITIIGILAAVAVPSYQDYVIRSKVSNSMAITNKSKIEISEYYMANGSWPTGCFGETYPHINNPTPEISQINWCNNADGKRLSTVFTAAASSALTDKYWWLIANNDANGNITWTCGTTTNPSYKMKCRHLPANCQLNCDPT